MRGVADHQRRIGLNTELQHQFLEHLRTQGIHTPFILFTGRGREEVAIKALNAEADFYLKKGTDVKAQYAELSNIIDQAVA